MPRTLSNTALYSGLTDYAPRIGGSPPARLLGDSATLTFELKLMLIEIFHDNLSSSGVWNNQIVFPLSLAQLGLNALPLQCRCMCGLVMALYDSCYLV